MDRKHTPKFPNKIMGEGFFGPYQVEMAHAASLKKFTMGARSEQPRHELEDHVNGLRSVIWPLPKNTEMRWTSLAILSRIRKPLYGTI
jgi:hypothetical protein